MNHEERHKLALQIADQLNNDQQLAQDVEPWLTQDTKGLLIDRDLDQMEEYREELEESIKEKDKEIEKLEARITDLETQLTEC